MSRTTRRPKFYIETSEIKEINRDLARAYRTPYKSIRVRMTDEELEADYQYRLARYEQRKQEAKRTFWWYVDNGLSDPKHWSAQSYTTMCGEPPVRYSRAYKRLTVPKDIDEVIAESKRDFSTYTRDGKWNETGRNTGFKKTAAKCVRRANKHFCNAVMRGEEVDNKIYPHEHLGDYLVWSFW